MFNPTMNYFSKITILFVLIMASNCQIQTTFAQTAIFRGFVSDASDGRALPGVNVVLTANDGALLGNATDGDGYFAVVRIPVGTYTFRISYIGYKTISDTLHLKAGDIRTRSFRLEPDQGMLDAVVVEAERPTGAAIITAGKQVIGQVEINRIPIPDVSGDLMAYVQTIPGVVSSGDRGGQLHIRGGTPTQNWVQLDGIPVFQPFHIVGFFSAFPSELIQRADIYAGGFGPQFGGRLSSVMDIYSRSGNKERFAGSVSLAPLLASVHVEGPLGEGQTSFLITARESVADRLLPEGRLKDELPFSFGDQFLKIHSNLGDNGQIGLSVINTHDRGTVDATEINKSESPDGAVAEGPPNQVAWKNMGIGLRYLILPPTQPFFADLQINLSSMANETGPKGDPERTSDMRRLGISGTVTRDYGHWKLRWGAQASNTNLEYSLDGFFQDLESGRSSVIEGALFMEGEIPVGQNLQIVPGLRLSSYPASQTVSPEPRFRATYWPGGRSGKYQFNAAFGVYRQELVGLQDHRDAGDVFTAWVVAPGNKAPTAVHGIVGWQANLIDAGVDVGLEAYYKGLTDMSIASWSAFPRFNTTLQPAEGRVLGFDARIEWKRGPWYAYGSYGLSFVEYLAMQESFGIWYGEAVQSFNPPHDRRHQLNLVGSYAVGGVTFSARWNFGSGVPFTRPIGFDDWIFMDRLRDVTREPGEYRVLFEKPYQGRLPAYHRLDLTADWKFSYGKTNGTVMAGAINAYNRANLFYFDLWTLSRVDQLPVIPTLGLKLEM